MLQSVSAQLYEQIIREATNSRLKESIERIKTACNFLESTNAGISPTSVGKYCSNVWGGPKTQSIRNADNTLFAYIKARKAEQLLPSQSKKLTFEHEIRDENIRAYISLLKAERDEAIRAKNRIIAGLRTIPGVQIDEFIRGGAGIPSVEQGSRMVKPLTEDAQDAIKNLLNPINLNNVGLEIHKKRIRSSITNKVLLEKQHTEALEELMDINKDKKLLNSPDNKVE